MTLENQNDSWSICQAGTLNSFSQRIRRNEIRRRRTKVVLGVSGVVAGCTSAILLMFNPIGRTGLSERSGIASPGQGIVSISADLSCPDVLDRCDHYLLGRIDDDSRQQIRSHLGHCPKCEEAYRTRAQALQVEYSVLLLPPAEQSFALYVAH